MYPRTSGIEANQIVNLTGGPYAFDHYRAGDRRLPEQEHDVPVPRGRPVKCAVTEGLVDAAARACDPAEIGGTCARTIPIPASRRTPLPPGGRRAHLRSRLDARLAWPESSARRFRRTHPRPSVTARDRAVTEGLVDAAARADRPKFFITGKPPLDYEARKAERDSLRAEGVYRGIGLRVLRRGRRAHLRPGRGDDAPRRARQRVPRHGRD